MLEHQLLGLAACKDTSDFRQEGGYSGDTRACARVRRISGASGRPGNADPRVASLWPYGWSRTTD